MMMQRLPGGNPEQGPISGLRNKDTRPLTAETGGVRRDPSPGRDSRNASMPFLPTASETANTQEANPSTSAPVNQESHPTPPSFGETVRRLMVGEKAELRETAPIATAPKVRMTREELEGLNNGRLEAKHFNATRTTDGKDPELAQTIEEIMNGRGAAVSRLSPDHNPTWTYYTSSESVEEHNRIQARWDAYIRAKNESGLPVKETAASYDPVNSRQGEITKPFTPEQMVKLRVLITSDDREQRSNPESYDEMLNAAIRKLESNFTYKETIAIIEGLRDNRALQRDGSEGKNRSLSRDLLGLTKKLDQFIETAGNYHINRAILARFIAYVAKEHDANYFE